jgi:hypothetical protein
MLTYTEMSKRTTLLARFRYLSLGGELGAATFGFDRHLNQKFYASHLWKQVRDIVIIRDNGCDLGVPDHLIMDRVLVHHMNPIKVQDLLEFNEDILDPEYLICCSPATHNAIHFGDERQLPRPFVERFPGDTDLW